MLTGNTTLEIRALQLLAWCLCPSPVGIVGGQCLWKAHSKYGLWCLTYSKTLAVEDLQSAANIIIVSHQYHYSVPFPLWSELGLSAIQTYRLQTHLETLALPYRAYRLQHVSSQLCLRCLLSDTGFLSDLKATYLHINTFLMKIVSLCPESSTVV